MSITKCGFYNIKTTRFISSESLRIKQYIQWTSDVLRIIYRKFKEAMMSKIICFLLYSVCKVFNALKQTRVAFRRSPGSSIKR